MLWLQERTTSTFKAQCWPAGAYNMYKVTVSACTRILQNQLEGKGGIVLVTSSRSSRARGTRYNSSGSGYTADLDYLEEAFPTIICVFWNWLIMRLLILLTSCHLIFLKYGLRGNTKSNSCVLPRSCLLIVDWWSLLVHMYYRYSGTYFTHLILLRTKSFKP